MTCKSWQTEAALRMLMNNLDPEVAEKPAELIVYGGAGKAARNWEAYHLIVKCLKNLENDETLLVQSGKPWDLQDPRGCAPGPDLKCDARPPLGELGKVQGAGRVGPDHVWPDDRRELDLYRDPGDPSGDV